MTTTRSTPEPSSWRGTSPVAPKWLEEESLLTKKQVAKWLNLPSTRGVDALAQRNIIKKIRLSHKCVRFAQSDIRAAIAKLTVTE